MKYKMKHQDKLLETIYIRQMENEAKAQTPVLYSGGAIYLTMYVCMYVYVAIQFATIGKSD